MYLLCLVWIVWSKDWMGRCDACKIVPLCYIAWWWLLIHEPKHVAWLISTESQITTNKMQRLFIYLFIYFYRRSACFRRNLRQWPTWCTLALFYNTFIAFLYVFRALYAHHQEVDLYWCSIWYRPLSVVVRCTGRPLTERTVPDAASIQFNTLTMSIFSRNM